MASQEQRIERIARLVAQPSVSSAAPGWDQSNRAVVDMLASWCDDAGFDVQVLPLPHAPEKANLIATLRRGREKLHYLNSVPIHDIAERWMSKFDRRRLSVLAELKRQLEGETDHG